MINTARGFLTIVLLSPLAVACRNATAHDATAAAPTGDATAAPPAPSPAADATPSALPPAEPAPPVAEPVSALRDIRASLDEIRAAAPDAEVTNSRPLHTEVLVGMTRDAIRNALGEPNTCEEDVAFDSQGNGSPVAPCESHQDWFYSFYHLPEHSVGGGPELLLQFDANGVCAAARWMHTQ
jgi:hypothetical protein